MKKTIIAILLLAILVVCGVLLLKGKTPIPGQNSIQTNKLQGAVVVSTFLCKFFIERQIRMHLAYFCMSPAHLHF
jgi:preprotein translocase subunit SecG